MPKYYEDVDEKPQKPKLACEQIRDELLECLLKSDCVRKGKNTPRECLGKVNDPSVPDECMRLRATFFECKRSLSMVKIDKDADDFKKWKNMEKR